jgi:hypothetical protein
LLKKPELLLAFCTKAVEGDDAGGLGSNSERLGVVSAISKNRQAVWPGVIGYLTAVNVMEAW